MIKGLLSALRMAAESLSSSKSSDPPMGRHHFFAVALSALSLGASPAWAGCVPDPFGGEICIPDPILPSSPSTPNTPSAAPLVQLNRSPATLAPLAAFSNWQLFSQDLLEPLPQKVPAAAKELVAPGPETSADPAYRFATTPGAYYSERDGWRLRAWGGTGGGTLLPARHGYGASTLNGGYAAGLKLDYAFSEQFRAGVFGRLAEQNINGSGILGFSRNSSTLQEAGAGLFAQYQTPDWFVSGALGLDGVNGTSPLALISSNAFGVRSYQLSQSGSAFNAALQAGLRWKLSESQLLEPSLLLSSSSLNLNGGSRFDIVTNNRYRIGAINSSFGGLDLGVTWRAPMRDGKNLFTPSIRVSWLQRGFLGDTPSTSIGVVNGQALNLRSPAVEASGLGLQGQLSYGFANNTVIYARGGAELYSNSPLWNLGGGLQLRF
ncbi:MAG: hypothetical protein RLZZ158_1779 [Cyanobacteriota bacterium]